jgi:hypothetical protein
MERFCRRPFFNPIDEYATARVQGYSNIAVELHATLLPNGQAMGASQFRVGGDNFAVKARMDSFIPLPEFKPWIGLQLQTLPTAAALSEESQRYESKCFPTSYLVTKS